MKMLRTVNSKTGEIQALADGETAIRVKTDTGGFVATCTLSVGKGIIKSDRCFFKSRSAGVANRAFCSINSDSSSGKC